MKKPQGSSSTLGFALTCGICGVLLGGTAAWANSRQCRQIDYPSTECLSKQPSLQIAEGATSGLLSGTFAALTIAAHKYFS